MSGAHAGSQVMTRSRSHERSRAGWLAWSGVALYAALVAGTVLIAPTESESTVLDLLAVVAVLACAVVGALIAGSRPRHPIGWMFLGLALSFGASWFAREYAVRALAVAPGSLPGGEVMAWLGLWIDMPAVAIVALFLPLLFPDGHLPSRRWRPVAWIAGGLVVVAVVTRMLTPANYPEAPTVRNPIGLDAQRGMFEALWSALDPALLLLTLLSVVALMDRVRRAGDEERQQIKWFAYAGGVLLVSFLLGPLTVWFPSLGATREFLTVAALVAVPAAVAIAILRYRLYDIDLIINRTVVYVLLTAILGGLYTGSLALFQRTFVAMTGQGSDLAIVMTLFVLATVFTPIKNALQERVDRRIKPVGKSATPASDKRPGIDDLVMLAELHRNGVLTDDEFAAKKKQVLGI